MSKTAQLNSVTSSRRSFVSIKSVVANYWWQIYLTPLLLVGAACAVLPYDTWLTHPDRLASLPGDVIRMTRLCELFAHGFGVLVVAAGVYTLAPKARVAIPRITVCAFWPGLVAHFLKLQVARFRPICYFDADSRANFPGDLATTWVGWLRNWNLNTIYAHQSFPSAHTATVWGLAIGMIWTFPRGKYLFIFIATLASIQRIVEYAHWPSDVLVGAAVGILCGGALQQNWGFGWLLGQLEAKLSSKPTNAKS